MKGFWNKLSMISRVYKPLLWLLVFLPGPVFAAVCDQSRPGWQPSDGPVTIFGEALHQLTTSGVAGLLVVMILALRFRNVWFTLVITLIAFIVAYLLYIAWSDPKGLMLASIAEGCVGPPFGAMAVLIGAGAFVLFWQFNGKKRSAP